MAALDELSRSQLRFWYPAGTDAAEVVFVVDALGTAQLLVAVFLPFGDEVGVCPLLEQTVLVELFADFLE